MDVRNPKKGKGMGNRGESVGRTERGASLVELVFILPILVLLILGIVDLGRLIQARLVVANVSREGGSLASRVGIYNEAPNPTDDRQEFGKVMNLLLASSFPLDVKGANGRIYVTRINAGFTKGAPDPWIYIRSSGGSMGVASIITGAEGQEPEGLSAMMRGHLTFQEKNEDADIDNLTVVEVFYYYRPITPLPKLMQDLLLSGNDGILIGSRSYF